MLIREAKDDECCAPFFLKEKPWGLLMGGDEVVVRTYNEQQKYINEGSAFSLGPSKNASEQMNGRTSKNKEKRKNRHHPSSEWSARNLCVSPQCFWAASHSLN